MWLLEMEWWLKGVDIYLGTSKLRPQALHYLRSTHGAMYLFLKTPGRLFVRYRYRREFRIPFIRPYPPKFMGAPWRGDLKR